MAVFLLSLPPGLLSQSSDKVTSLHEGSKARLPESYFNTIIQDIEGKRYKLVLIGDLLPELTINGRRVQIKELENYQATINRLSKIIWERQRKEAERKNAPRKKRAGSSK